MPVAVPPRARPGRRRRPSWYDSVHVRHASAHELRRGPRGRVTGNVHAATATATTKVTLDIVVVTGMIRHGEKCRVRATAVPTPPPKAPAMTWMHQERFTLDFLPRFPPLLALCVRFLSAPRHQYRPPRRHRRRPANTTVLGVSSQGNPSRYRHPSPPAPGLFAEIPLPARRCAISAAVDAALGRRRKDHAARAHVHPWDGQQLLHALCVPAAHGEGNRRVVVVVQKIHTDYFRW